MRNLWNLKNLKCALEHAKLRNHNANVAEAFATIVAFYIGVMDGDDMRWCIPSCTFICSNNFCSCFDALKLHSFILTEGHMFPRPLSLHVWISCQTYAIQCERIDMTAKLPSWCFSVKGFSWSCCHGWTDIHNCLLYENPIIVIIRIMIMINISTMMNVTNINYISFSISLCLSSNISKPIGLVTKPNK